MGSVKDGIETRERLMRAAVDLYSAKGFSGASLQDVVHRARVTKGAFYHHFESKAHLIEAIHTRFVELQIDDITAIIDKELPPAESLAELIEMLFRNMIENKESISLFLREHPRMPEDIDRAMRALRRKYEQLLVGEIDRGRKAGVFHSELPTNVLLYGILGMCNWATQWYDPKRAPAPEVIGRHYARMVINGLTTPGAADQAQLESALIGNGSPGEAPDRRRKRVRRV
jgi:AcrR family transcriptional regulator